MPTILIGGLVMALLLIASGITIILANMRATARATIASPTIAQEINRSTPSPKERLEMGYDSYQAQGCVGCHELDTIGAIASTGPTNNKMASIAAQRIKEASYTGNATNAAQYIRESIIEPAAYLVEDYPNVMPPYGTLPAEELELLVEMLLQQ
jgi:cytochrome c oxidase subunit 2